MKGTRYSPQRGTSKDDKERCDKKDFEALDAPFDVVNILPCAHDKIRRDPFCTARLVGLVQHLL